MPLSVHTGGAWVVPALSVRRGGSWLPALMYVRTGGVWVPVTQLAFTVTTATNGSGAIGYSSLTGTGSVSGLTMPAGLALDTLTSKNAAPNAGTVLQVGGFSADPGIGWFSSLTANLHTLTAASATYSYSSGIAAWVWSTPLGWTSGSSFPVTISF